MALVIGNNKYTEGSALKNCVNDATDISRKLSPIGFNSTLMTDVNYKTMRGKINEFIERISDGDLIVFFFAGHGIQWSDQNFLIPIDYSAPSPSEHLKTVAINAQHILEDISKKKPYVILFILDCCRNYYVYNHAQERSVSSMKLGLTEMKPVDTSHAGSLIGFACAPGQTASDKSTKGGNGLFTSHLLKYIDHPEMSIEEIMCNVCNGVTSESNDKQCPYRVSSLRIHNIRLTNTNMTKNIIGGKDTNMTKYIIEGEDDLWKLSVRYGCKYKEIQAANFGVDELNLQDGQVVNIPVTKVLYKIKPHDTFEKLGKLYHTTVAKIKAANPNVNHNNLEIGVMITIPLQ